MSITLTQDLMDFFTSRKVNKVHYGATTLNVGSTIKTKGNLELTLESGYFFDENNPPRINNDFGLLNTTPYLRNGNTTVILAGDYLAETDIWTLPLTTVLGNSYTYPTNTPDGEVTPPPDTQIKYVVTSSDINYFNSKNVTLTSGTPTDRTNVVIGSEIGKGETLILIANTDYEIVAASVEYQSFTSGNFVVASDKKTASLILPSDVGNISLAYWQINTKSVVVEPPPFQGFTVKQKDITKLTNNKGELFINGVKAVIGSTFVTGDFLEVKPFTDYEITFLDFASFDGYYKTFNIVDGIASATMDKWDDDWQTGSPIANSQLINASFNTIEYESVTPIPPDIEPSKGINDVYLVDSDNMRILSTNNFEVYFSDGDGGGTWVNYSKYILGLIKLPFVVDASLIKDYNRTIKLKDRNFNAKGDLLFTDILTLDLGIIQVPKVENNLLDYDSTIAVLHLPYCDTINIDIDYVVGHDIGIYYDINLYDGMATINITSSKIDGVILTKSIDMGITVPFGNLEDIPSKNDPQNVDLGADNGIKNPYIELLKNDAVLPYGFFTSPVLDESLLIDQKGYVVIENIDLKCSAGRDEKEMIVNLLNNGVIIND